MTKAGSICFRLALLLYNHLFTTIHAKDVHRFCRSYAVPATGADILAVMAIGCGGGSCFAACCVPAASTPRGEAPFNAVHLDIGPALVQDELTKGIGWLGDAPPDSRVITDVKIPGRGRIAELLVVVGPAAAAILYTVLNVPEVHAFVQHGGDHVLDWAVQRPRADVQFMAGGRSLVPCFGNSNMTIGPRGALYGDDGFLQLPAEVFGVQCSENLFKVSSGPGSLDGFFHFRFLAFAFKIKILSRALKIFVSSAIDPQSLGQKVSGGPWNTAAERVQRGYAAKAP